MADRLYYDDLALDRMLHMTGGHPYFLQLLCHILVEHANQEQRSVVMIAHVRSAIERALMLADGHFVSPWHEVH